jgi:hypothetical protein
VFHPRVSDLDLIAVDDGPLDAVAALSRADTPPGRGLDLAVYPRTWLRAPTQDPPWRQAIRWDQHGIREICSHPEYDRALDVAVVRQHGIRASGPDVTAVFGVVPDDVLLAACRSSIARWAARTHFNAPASGVLNAARSWLYWSERRIASKIEGGRWAAARLEDSTLIRRALDYQQTGTGQAFADREVSDFIRGVYARIREPPPARVALR